MCRVGRKRQPGTVGEPFTNTIFVEHTGTSLKAAGGESFEAAVKEISDKTLNVSEGMVIQGCNTFCHCTCVDHNFYRICYNYQPAV